MPPFHETSSQRAPMKGKQTTEGYYLPEALPGAGLCAAKSKDKSNNSNNHHAEEYSGSGFDKPSLQQSLTLCSWLRKEWLQLWGEVHQERLRQGRSWAALAIGSGHTFDSLSQIFEADGEGGSHHTAALSTIVWGHCCVCCTPAKVLKHNYWTILPCVCWWDW